MRATYLQVTSIRLFVALALLFSVIKESSLFSLLLTACFLGLHWFAQGMGQRQGLERKEYQYSSLLSSFVVLIIFVILLTKEIIPVVLASVFVTVFIIKMLFSMQDNPMKSSEERKRPVKTNWSLTASLLFLSCYYFGEDHGLILVSSLFLAYLVFSLGIYARMITELRVKNRRR